MDVFFISTWAQFTLLSLLAVLLSFISMGVHMIDGELRGALKCLVVAITFIAAFVTGTNHCSKLTRRAPQCRCEEIYLAGVKNGVGVTLEAYTNTLHEAGIVMIPIGGRDE